MADAPGLELLGQRVEVARMLRRARALQLPHAVLVVGPAGTGKSTMLRAFAQALLCPTHGTALPCGSCSTCRRIANDQHPDLHRLQPGDEQTEIKADAVRAVIDALQRHAFEGRARLLLLDPADALNVTGQNILLKTLEEPLPDTWLLLAASRPDALLPTVRSRCAQLRLRPVDAETVRGRLRAQAADPAAVEFAVRHCAGSIGLAQQLLDPALPGLADALAAWAIDGAGDPVELAQRLLQGAEDREQREQRVRFSFVILRSLLRERLCGALAPAQAATYSAASIEPWVRRLECLFAAESDLALRIPVEQTLTAMLLRGAGCASWSVSGCFVSGGGA